MMMEPRHRIEHLEGLLDRERAVHDACAAERNRLRAEIERLRAALDEIDAHCPRKHPGWAGLCFNDIIDIVSEARAAIKLVEGK